MPNSDLPNYRHPSLQQQEHNLLTVYDCWSGLDGTDAKQRYLPIEQDETPKEYQSRALRSEFDNRFSPCIKSFAGLLSDLALTEQGVPQSLLDNQENVDLQGNDLQIFLKLADELALRDGAALVLTEYPPEDPTIQSQADFVESGRRPYWVLYDIASLCNWRIETIGGVPVLMQVVLKETVEVFKGTYGTEYRDQYRILTLDWEEKVSRWINSYQVVEIVTDDQGQESEQLVEDSDGIAIAGSTSLNYIPLRWYPSVSGKPFEVQQPPFLNLARLNLQHFRLQSDQDEVLHKLAMPAAVRIWPQMIPDPVPPLRLGPHTSIEINQGGDFKFVEITGNGVDRRESRIRQIEDAMDRISLSFLSGGEVQRTATEAVLDSSQVQASLRGMARLKESTVQSMVMDWAAYTGEEAGGGIAIADNLIQPPLTADQIRALKELSSEGFISVESLLQLLIQGKVLPPDFDIDSATRTGGLIDNAVPQDSDEAQAQTENQSATQTATSQV